ncbi:MAG: response regulator [Calditrichaeota bacterium]|nr:response regulator [Calditrichota bacterium]
MTGPQKRVLLVDDEEDLTWTLSKKLSKDSDKFELITVNSGREAIEVLNQVPVDLVITDVRMPEVSGLDLLVKIKETYPQTKVIIMTAYGSSDVHKEATERGCFHYIEKPFEINEIRQIILDALKEEKGFRGSVADFQLSDIIQLNCLGRLTTALLVKRQNETGTIYFQEGNIVHAETDHLEGEDAFYYIMSWDGGEFSVLRNKFPPRETIHKSWQNLLLESMRLKDEQSHLVKEEQEREKRKRNRRLQQLLDKVFKSDGVEHILIHTHAGFPIFYLGRFSGDVDKISELGDKLGEVVAGVEQSAGKIFGKDLLFWEGIFKKYIYLFIALPDEDAYLSIIGTPRMNTGFVRLEIKKQLREITRLIASHPH